MTGLRQHLLRWLPAPWRQALKRLYYPSLLRRFRAEQWPGAAVVGRLLRPGDLVVDAGANVGYVSLLLARWVGPAGRVHSFEPIPETCALLRHNMRALGLDQVTVHGVALSSAAGEGRMDIPDYPGGGKNYYEAHLVAGAQPGDRAGIPLRRLDDVLADETRPLAFVKMDVEGHEWEAAQGARRRLAGDRPALYVELSGPPTGEGPAARLSRHLIELGYGIYWQQGAALRPVGPADHPADAFFLTPEQLRRVGG